MTRIQRVENIVSAFVLVLLSLVLVVVPEDGYLVVFELVAITWLIQAVRLLAYYFTMARFMVGGRRILLKGVILFDLSIVTFSLDDIPKLYIMLYLVVGMLFVNVVDVFKAFDEKKCGNPHWKFKMSAGVTGIILASICLMNYDVPSLSGYIYAFELSRSAVVRLINVFRRTEITYIP